jgi:hypothetical protein
VISCRRVGSRLIKHWILVVDGVVMVVALMVEERKTQKGRHGYCFLFLHMRLAFADRVTTVLLRKIFFFSYLGSS